MKADDRAAHVETALAALDARFDYDAARRSLRIEYSVKNSGDAPLMTLDRGVAVGGKTAAAMAGTSAAPLGKQDGDALTLSHVALALPKPAPTVPRVALAAHIERGATHVSRFETEVPATARRVRYCLGVAPFSDDAFSPASAGDAAWRASFTVAGTQTLLCTPWFDITEGRFLRD